MLNSDKPIVHQCWDREATIHKPMRGKCDMVMHVLVNETESESKSSDLKIELSCFG